MSRFHNTDKGPRPCTARVRECPIGGMHFTTKEEAVAAYEFSEGAKHGMLGLKKRKDPEAVFTKHVRDADKLVASMKKDFAARDLRQQGRTLYHELLS